MQKYYHRKLGPPFLPANSYRNFINDRKHIEIKREVPPNLDKARIGTGTGALAEEKNKVGEGRNA